MTFLTKDQILQSDDRTVEEVSVPEWGGVVRVRTMTGKMRDALEESIVNPTSGKNRDYDNIRARVVAMSLVDSNGDPMFNLTEVEKLGEKSSIALDRVFGVAQRLSGITKKDVAELSGNLSPGRSDDSISG